MTTYVALAAIVFIANAIPAFAPPTWSILVFFIIHYSPQPVATVLIGVAAATSGRALLAWYFRKFTHLMPKGYVANMERLGKYVEGAEIRKFGVLTLFLFSPISSAQLFEAAGIARSINIRPLIAIFACGRLISYSAYVTGATVLQQTSIGDLFKEYVTSPTAVGIQILLIIILVLLGNVQWGKKR